MKRRVSKIYDNLPRLLPSWSSQFTYPTHSPKELVYRGISHGSLDPMEILDCHEMVPRPTQFLPQRHSKSTSIVSQTSPKPSSSTQPSARQMLRCILSPESFMDPLSMQATMRNGFSTSLEHGALVFQDGVFLPLRFPFGGLPSASWYIISR